MLNNHYFYYEGFFDNYHHKKNGLSIVADRITIPIIILVYNAPKEGQNSKEEKDTKTDTTTSSYNDNKK
jgi:hypothetical protein